MARMHSDQMAALNVSGGPGTSQQPPGGASTGGNRAPPQGAGVHAGGPSVHNQGPAPGLRRHDSGPVNFVRRQSSKKLLQPQPQRPMQQPQPVRMTQHHQPQQQHLQQPQQQHLQHQQQQQICDQIYNQQREYHRRSLSGRPNNGLLQPQPQQPPVPLLLRKSKAISASVEVH